MNSPRKPGSHIKLKKTAVTQKYDSDYEGTERVSELQRSATPEYLEGWERVFGKRKRQ